MKIRSVKNAHNISYAKNKECTLNDYIVSVRKLIGNMEISTAGARVVILNSANKVLLEERSDFKLWGLPGGTADPGEDIIRTAEREAFEETGLSIINPIPFGFSSSPMLERITFPNGDKLHSFNLLFYTRDYTGDVQLSEESTRLEWFELYDLPPMLKNMKATVTAFLAYTETSQFQIVTGESA